MKDQIKGRGAQIKTHNKFEQHQYTNAHIEGLDIPVELNQKTKTTKVEAKTIVNKVKSPDTSMQFSLNPYQGCEHGCVYCYARNSHEYWGYNSGIDFENNILIKEDAPQLLAKKLSGKSWQAHPIILSGNTDCYQPLEKKLEITRKLLEVFLRFKHPVGIITKNSLISRDLDLLEELNKDGLVQVHISITTLDERLKNLMEPRTASINKRLETISILSEKGIPVNGMIAPIIPGLNSHEVLNIAKAASKAGALSIAHTIVRLNGSIAEVFTDWIEKTFPDKASKVLHQIAECHGGQLNDSRFGTRMKGEGVFAEQISRTMKLAKRRYFKDKKMPNLNCELHQQFKTGQLSLF